jgi:hypothetical protein
MRGVRHIHWFEVLTELAVFDNALVSLLEVGWLIVCELYTASSKDMLPFVILSLLQKSSLKAYMDEEGWQYRDGIQWSGVNKGGLQRASRARQRSLIDLLVRGVKGINGITTLL